ncbi:MAG: Asp23/Gls24 family envelope stress response protein [Firmicutes bacterium]|nr:Asp23/Gls24 family envelope stress response protein [Bacillota bacterium]
MSGNQRTGYGSIEIAREALATIAGAAAVRCYGIVGMAPRGLRQGVAEILGRDSLGQGVEVRIEGEEVKVDLWVVMCYGVKIAEVAHNVMEAVRYEIEKMTGLRTAEVNVNVVGVKVF